MAGQRFGQHFLRSEAILARIAAAACGQHVNRVVEIGPGGGALTAHLLKCAQSVIAVEIDPALIGHLGERFTGEPNLELIHADILTVNLAQWGSVTVAGNLPYYITSPIIERVLAIGPLLEQAVFLVQREVAQRLCAAPGSRDYGYLSAHTQLFSSPEYLFTVRPGAFQPPPKVDSAVVRLTPRDPSALLGDVPPAGFVALLSHAFRQKRKTLRNNLLPHYRREAVEALPEAGRRAETLSLQEFASVYRRLNAI